MTLNSTSKYLYFTKDSTQWQKSKYPILYYFLTDTGIPNKPRELLHQDLYYSYEQDETGVLSCNVQSNPPPAFRWLCLKLLLEWIPKYQNRNLLDFLEGLLKISLTKKKGTRFLTCNVQSNPPPVFRWLC